ncbi:MAG TPA: hypothetical protein VE714_01880 [Gemmatimonadales bacterium]|nr:hypothetical protein [Gemmatimonadales bacterium]
MTQMTIRQLDDELHRKLKVQAARHGRSADAEALARTLPRPDTDSADLVREERDRRSGLIE